MLCGIVIAKWVARSNLFGRAFFKQCYLKLKEGMITGIMPYKIIDIMNVK